MSSLRAFVATVVLGAPILAGAVEVQSTTSTFLSFRDCIAGENVCDRFERPAHVVVDGLPGSTHSRGDFEDPEFGSGSASARLTDKPGGSVLHARVSSSPGKRNGASALSLRKYVNEADEPVTVEVVADASWKQSVPEANAAMPTDSHGSSGASVHLVINQLGIVSVDAGDSVEDNFHLLLHGPPEAAGVTAVGERDWGSPSNVSDQGQEQGSLRVSLGSGEHIWVLAVLQSIAVDGADVTADMNTEIRLLEPD
jgi:hypothetical protein